MSPQFGRKLLALAGLALLPAMAAAQQPAVIQGRVQSQAGMPLPAVNVLIEGMGLGTVTRDDGTYSFIVPAARVSGQPVTLTARRLGHTPQSVQITLQGGTITRDFTLAEAPLRLDEVVITGAGTETTREKLGNVVNKVSSAEITRAAEPNVVQALAGKAPNVVINQQSGEPGASSYIRIRGAKSIQGSGQPLFVVDGVPIDNTTFATGPSTASTVAPNRASDINPADIESVEILKGSAAAAIYGARAAQGVVLITTKRGQAGQTRWSLRSTATVDQPNNTIPLQTRFGQGSDGAASTCATVNCRPSALSWGAPLAAGTRTYDHFDEVFDTGVAFENVLTASGGSDRTTFFASIGQLNQEGIIVGPNNNYRRTTARVNATHRLLEDLEVGGNIAYTDVKGNFVQKGSNISGLMLGALRTPPEFDNRQWRDPQFGLHRSYRFPNPGPTSDRASRGYDNPFFVAHAMKNEEELGRAFGNVNLAYTPTAWLNVRYSLGGDYYADWRLEALPLTSSTYSTGRVIRADLINYSVDHNLVATASHAFSPDLAGTLTVGQNLNARRYRQVYVTGFDLIAPEPFALQNTVTQQPSEFRSRVNTESYFAQVTADLYDQLFLTAAARNDGFSTFGASERRHWFPKVSAAWTFTKALGRDEARGVLNFGKLRLAYGETGKEPEVYQTITALSAARQTFYGGWGDYLDFTQGGVGGLVSGTQLGNNDLRPERTKEIEGGIDLGLWDQRVDMGLTYYDSRSVDVILEAPLSPSTGYFSRLENAAEISNEGWEATLNVRPVQRENVSLEFGVQWARNRSEVLDLKGADFVDKSAGTFTGSYGSVTKGEQVGVIRGEDFYRCGRGSIVDGIDIDNTAGHCQGAPAGALYIGPDGFPLYDPTDRVIADPNPDWTGSLRGTLTLMRRWQVATLLDVKQGGDVWNGTRGALYYFGTHKDTEIRGQTRTFGRDFYPGAVAGPGAGQAVTIDQDWYFSNIGSGFTGPASQFIEDGSFVKLREVAVTYTADQPFVQRMGFTTVDFRVAGRNLVTWTDYTGIDPETNLGGAEVFVQGIDYFNNPQARTFIFSIGLNR